MPVKMEAFLRWAASRNWTTTVEENREIEEIDVPFNGWPSESTKTNQTRDVG
jgi:hypothetical protein